MAKKTYKIRITARQMVSYDQTVEMSAAEWRELRKAIDAGDDDRVGSIAELWIDTAIVNDAEDIDGGDVDAEVVK